SPHGASDIGVPHLRTIRQLPLISPAGRSMKRVDVVIGIVVRDGTILICQRQRSDALAGYWEFPGGKLEPGETIEQCLARELREELAIIARPIEPLAVIEHDYPHVQVRL